MGSNGNRASEMHALFDSIDFYKFTGSDLASLRGDDHDDMYDCRKFKQEIFNLEQQMDKRES